MAAHFLLIDAQPDCRGGRWGASILRSQPRGASSSTLLRSGASLMCPPAPASPGPRPGGRPGATPRPGPPLGADGVLAVVAVHRPPRAVGLSTRTSPTDQPAACRRARHTSASKWVLTGAPPPGAAPPDFGQPPWPPRSGAAAWVGPARRSPAAFRTAGPPGRLRAEHRPDQQQDGPADPTTH